MLKEHNENAITCGTFVIACINVTIARSIIANRLLLININYLKIITNFF